MRPWHPVGHRGPRRIRRWSWRPDTAPAEVLECDHPHVRARCREPRRHSPLLPPLGPNDLCRCNPPSYPSPYSGFPATCGPGLRMNTSLASSASLEVSPATRVCSGLVCASLLLVSMRRSNESAALDNSATGVLAFVT